jgi:hypothetical protein
VLKEIYDKELGKAIIAIFSYDTPIILETDVSDFALRAQLI